MSRNYLLDLQNQVSNLRDALTFQGISVSSNEGLETLVPKVDTIVGVETLPRYNFCKRTITQALFDSINFSTTTDFSFCFASTGGVTDFSKLNTLSAINMDFMFVRKSPTLGKYFRMDNVQTASHMFGGDYLFNTGSGTVYAYSINLNVDAVEEHTAGNLTDISGMFSEIKFSTNQTVDKTQQVVNFFKKIHMPNVKNISKMFYRIEPLNVDIQRKLFEVFQYLDTSKVEQMINLFAVSTIRNAFEGLPIIDCSNLKDASYMFSSIKFSGKGTLDLSNWNFPKLENADSMFYNTSGNSNQQVEKIFLGKADGGTVKKMGMFLVYYANVYYTDIDMSGWDLSAVNDFRYSFSHMPSLVNLSFGTNYGKGFTQLSNNYYLYNLEINNSNSISHESLMSIINNVYDLNLTYPSRLYTQSIIMGATNKAKLTAEEIAIATNKGWTVS